MERLDQLPPISTARLRLQVLTLEDAQAFRDMTEEVAESGLIHFLQTPFGLLDAKALISSNGNGRDCFWGVWRQDDAELIGAIGTHFRGDRQIEIGYWFGSSSRGKGTGTEAVFAVVSALKQACPDRLIFAECRPQNIVSWQLLERIGFRADGTDGVAFGRRTLVLDR